MVLKTNDMLTHISYGAEELWFWWEQHKKIEYFSVQNEKFRCMHSCPQLLSLDCERGESHAESINMTSNNVMREVMLREHLNI